MFSYEFCEIFKNTLFTEHVQASTFEVTKAEKFFWELSTERKAFSHLHAFISMLQQSLF